MNKDLKTALILGGVVIAILIIGPLVWGAISGWQGSGYGMMGSGGMMGGMMGSGMMGGFGWAGLASIFWVVLLGLIIWAVVVLVRGIGQSNSSTASGTNSALDILKKRYARGEINKEEFEEKKKDLA